MPTKRKPNQQMDKLKAFVRTNGTDYLKDPNITSVGIGYKTVKGKSTGEIAIQFTVERKAGPEALESLGTRSIPEFITVGGEKIKTDVIERRYAASYIEVELEAALPVERKRRIDPIKPGVSVSNFRGSAGTIGCIVYDNETGSPYILSNWHVLNTPGGVVGDDVLQPGPHDDNRVNANRMGKLVRSFLGAAGDCAVASIEDRRFEAEILDLGVKPDAIGEAELGDKVIKSGRTTAVTHGIVTRVNAMFKINYGGATGEQSIGGFEIAPDPVQPPANGEVSMGGDSGSIWLFKTSSGKPGKVIAGLHFGGESDGNPDEFALACYPKSVFEKLSISLKKPTVATTPGASVDTSSGFNTSFLAKPVPLPVLSPENKADAVKLGGSEVIPYTHFSLAHHSKRKFAIWVGWNVDGARIRRESRKGVPFVKDPRLPLNVQVGDELYRGNRLDRGHIARRADLLWGGEAEAKKANTDSFFFTNITPQMDDFNQSSKSGIWGRLEDAVFSEVDVQDLRISVFGGPVFHEDDRVFRQVQVPREFWKLLLFVEGGKLKAKAFLLTQNLNALEALDLDQFKVFQVNVSEIEDRCGITFSNEVRTAGAMRLAAESVRTALASVEEIDWS